MNPQVQRTQIDRDEYQKGRDEFLSVSWLKELSEEDKSESLGKFFDDKTSVYLKESKGITDENKISEYRATFISKYGGVKKKESTSENGGLSQESADTSSEKEESTSQLGIYDKISELPGVFEPQKGAPALKQLEEVSEIQRQVKIDEYDAMSPVERLNVAQSKEGVPITKEREIFLRETSLPATETEVNTANEILKEISSKYIGPEGKVSQIGGKEYEDDLYNSINSVAGDMNSFEIERVFKVINSELRKENENNLQRISEDNLDKKFFDEVGEETYNKIKKEITNPILTQESDMFNDVEFLFHVPGTKDELFSEDYVKKAVNNDNWEWVNHGILAPPTQSEIDLRKQVRSGDEVAGVIAYNGGLLGIKNPMFGDEYKPIAQRLMNANATEAGAKLEAGAIAERTRLSKTPKVDLDIEVGDYMEQFMRPEEVTAKMYNEQLYEATLEGQSEEDIQKIEKLRDMSLGNNSIGEELYDPKTGSYIGRDKASPNLLDWNNEVDQYALKYTKDLNQKEDLIRVRTRLYFEKQYLEGEVNKRQSQIKAPWYDLNTGQGEEGMPLFGGSLLLDKYKENHQRLLAVNTVLTQNVNPATIERSLSTTFGETLSETLGIRQQTLQDIPRDFVAAMEEKGAFVSKEQKERVETTISEEIASGIATTIPELAKFVAVTSTMGALGVQEAVASYFTTMKGFTSSNTIKDVLSAIEPLLMTEGTFQLAGQDFGTGLGEEFGGQAYDALGIEKLIAKLPGVKRLKAAFSTIFKLASRSGGETFQEYTGEMFTRMIEGNEEFGEALKNTVGDDPFKKLVSIYAVAGTLSFGFMGSDYKQALKNIENEIINFEATDPENIATQEEIKNKVKENLKGEDSDIKKEPKKPADAETIKKTTVVENEIKEEEITPKKEVVETPDKGEQQVTEDVEATDKDFQKIVDISEKENVNMEEAAEILKKQKDEERADSEAIESDQKVTEKVEYPIADKGEWYGDADYEARGGVITNITPDEFLERSKPLEIDEETRENVDDLKKHIQEGKTLDPLSIYVDDVTDVKSTDGRHRAIAAKELGMETVPVIDFTQEAKVEPEVKEVTEKAPISKEVTTEPTLEEFTEQNPIEEASGKVFNLPETKEGLYKVSPKQTKSGRVILESESGKRKTFSKKEFQQQRFEGSITESKPETESVVFESKADPRYSLIKEGGELQVFNKAKGKIVNRSKNKKALVEEYKQSIIPELQKGKKVEYKEGTQPSTEIDYIKDVIKESENPSEVATAWMHSKAFSTNEPTLDDIIADNLPKITPDTFNQFGDKNLTNAAIRLNYFTSKAKGGVSLDMAARRVMEEGMLSSEGEISGKDEKDIIQDIVDFITANPGGTRVHQKPETLADELSVKFTEMTGLDITEEYAAQLSNIEEEAEATLTDEQADMILSQDIESFQEEAWFQDNVLPKLQAEQELKIKEDENIEQKSTSTIEAEDVGEDTAEKEAKEKQLDQDIDQDISDINDILKKENDINPDDEFDGIMKSSILPIKEVFLNPLIKLGGVKARVEQKIFAKNARKIEDAIANNVKRNITKSNKARRMASQGITSWYNGIARTQADVTKKMALKGEWDWAAKEAELTQKALYEIVNNNETALSKLDRVLDPEFYKEVNATQIAIDLHKNLRESEVKMVEIDVITKNSKGEEVITETKKARLTPEHVTDILLERDNAPRIDYAGTLVNEALSDLSDLNKSITKESDLNNQEKTLLNLVKKINNLTHNMNYKMGLIEEEVYEKYKGKYTGREYTPYAMPSDAAAALEEAGLGNKTRLDETIYKRKKDVSEWMASNKLEDPVYTAVKRMAQTKQNAAVFTYATYIVSQPELVMTKEEVAADPEKAKGFIKMAEKGYGPLNGKYVAGYIAEDFQGYFMMNDSMNKMYDWFKAYDKIKPRQFLKKFHTVYSPGVQLGNRFSNIPFAISTGVGPIVYLKNYPKAMKINKEKGAGGVYEILVKSGILGSDVITRDQQPLFGDSKKVAEEVDKHNNIARKLAKAADEYATSKYQSGDDLAKITAYISLTEDYGFEQKEALIMVYEGFQNYATVGKIWDVASKTPLIGPVYVKFQADLQRLVKNRVTRSPLSTLQYLGYMTLMGTLASRFSGEDDEERELRTTREFLPKLNTPLGSIPLVVKMGGYEVNVARYTSPFYIYDLGDAETNLEFFTNFMPYQVQEPEKGGILPVFGDVLAGPWIEAFVADVDFRGKSIADPGASKHRPSGRTTEEKLWNQINYVMRSQIPFWKSANDIYLINETGRDLYGRKRDWSKTLLSSIIRVEEFGDDQYKEVAEKKLNGLSFEMYGLGKEQQGASKRAAKDIEKMYMDYEAGSIDQATLLKREEKRIEILTEEILRLTIEMGLVKVEAEEFVKKYSRFIKAEVVEAFSSEE